LTPFPSMRPDWEFTLSGVDPSDRLRTLVELAIISKALEAIQSAGWLCCKSSDFGIEQGALPVSLISTIHEVGYSEVHFYNPVTGPYASVWVTLIPGNGYDVIQDSHTILEEVLTPVENYAAALELEWPL
jgi:hypothetical protein